MPRLKVGNKVRVQDDAGLHAGKEGVLIPKKDIPMKDNGVPDLPGCSLLLQAKEVGVKQADGTIFVIYLNRLDFVSVD